MPRYIEPIKTIQVLRLETANGEGVYRDNKDKDKPSIWTTITGGFIDNGLHPKPITEFGIEPDMYQEYIYGFKTLEQYKTWVFNPHWRKRLVDCKVQLSTYEVPVDSVMIGRCQVMFVKNDAKLVSVQSPLIY